jgi:hypothetical protein
VHQVVVVLTEQRQIGQVRGTSVRFPPPDVVRIHENGVGAAGEAAVAVTPNEFPTLRFGRKAVLSALVHRVAVVVIDSQDHGGITSDPANRVSADQPVAFEFTGEIGGFIEQDVQRHVGHNGE